MKLCSESRFLSAALMKSRMPADDTPCDSGLLRGNPASAPCARSMLANVKTNVQKPVRMPRCQQIWNKNKFWVQRQSSIAIPPTGLANDTLPQQLKSIRWFKYNPSGDHSRRAIALSSL